MWRVLSLRLIYSSHILWIFHRVFSREQTEKKDWTTIFNEKNLVKDVNTKDDIIFCYAASNFPKCRMIIFCCSKIICI